MRASCCRTDEPSMLRAVNHTPIGRLFPAIEVTNYALRFCSSKYESEIEPIINVPCYSVNSFKSRLNYLWHLRRPRDWTVVANRCTVVCQRVPLNYKERGPPNIPSPLHLAHVVMFHTIIIWAPEPIFALPSLSITTNQSRSQRLIYYGQQCHTLT